MLTVQLVEDVAGMEALRGRWTDLAARARSAEPVMTPLWIFAWWRQFGDVDGRKLRLVTVEDDGVLIGIAPASVRTVMHRHAIPVRRIELLATGEDQDDEICSDYVGIVAARGREADVARAVTAAWLGEGIEGWDDLVMPAMSADDPCVEQLRAALTEAGARVEVTETGACPYIPLPSTWNEYLAKLHGSHRRVVTRALRELDAWSGGDHALVRASTPAELEEGRRILHSLHGERWSGEGRTGVFASERFTRFHDEVMRGLLDETDGASLDLLWLTVKGEAIASVYNIVYRNKVYFYQSGRKLDVPKNLKPGIAIHALAIQRSIAAGHTEYDFLKGESQYKRQLALATRSLVTLRAVAPTLRARAVGAACDLAERAIEEVRKVRTSSSRPPPMPPAEPSGPAIAE